MDEELAEMAGFGRLELEAFWQDRFGEAPPKMRSLELMRRRTAWRLQMEKYGDLTKQSKRRLKALTKASAKDIHRLHQVAPTLKPGTTLTREWQGVKHSVKVLNEGFDYRGNHYRTLSSIARFITGTRWSGPVFFGLKKPANHARVSK